MDNINTIHTTNCMLNKELTHYGNWTEFNSYKQNSTKSV